MLLGPVDSGVVAPVISCGHQAATRRSAHPTLLGSGHLVSPSLERTSPASTRSRSFDHVKERTFARRGVSPPVLEEQTASSKWAYGGITLHERNVVRLVTVRNIEKLRPDRPR